MPPDTATPKTQNVLDGFLQRQEIGAQLRCTDRTIIRYERAGMPFIAFGKLRLYDPVKVRAWLMSHASEHNAPSRGRPSKKAAA